MNTKKEIQAEGGEIILRNSKGDIAIIPAKYRLEAMDMVREGCHGCLDKLIETLPKYANKAEDGSVYGDPPKMQYQWSSGYNETLPTNLNTPTYDANKAHQDKLAEQKRQEELYRQQVAAEEVKRIAAELNATQTPVYNQPNNASIQYGQTDLRRQDAIDPNNRFMYPQLSDENNRSMGDFSLGVAGMALPIPALEGMGKIPSLGTGVKNMIKNIDNVNPYLFHNPKPSLNITNKPIQAPQNTHNLTLKSLEEGSPLRQSISKNTGEINVENALRSIEKSEGKAKYDLVRQGFPDELPKTMKWDDFEQAATSRLIPLETKINPVGNSGYGIETIGRKSKVVNENNIKSVQTTIDNLTTNKNKLKIDIEDTGGWSDNIGGRKYYEGEKYYKVDREIFKTEKEAQDYLVKRTNELENSIKQNTEQLNAYKNNEVAKEQYTLTFSNKEQLGKGSSAHNNPEETLGHTHIIIDADTPRTLNVTQLQSDAFQGTYNIMSKGKFQKASNNLSEVIDDRGIRYTEEQSKNFSQKQLLAKEHQSRYIQEIIDHAAKRGDIDKIRIPTSETAAKVQGYSKSKTTWMSEGQKVKFNDGEGIINDNTLWSGNLDVKLPNGETKLVSLEELKNYNKELIETFKSESKYTQAHQTILKKYQDMPKELKKLGIETKTVTDAKGNTWYEFDIPKSFKEGKGKIRAFEVIAPITGAGLGASQLNKE